MQATYILALQGYDVVYFVRHACHFRTEASEGVYLMEHEQLIIRQGDSRRPLGGLIAGYLSVLASAKLFAMLAALSMVGVLLATHTSLALIHVAVCIPLAFVEGGDGLLSVALVAYLGGHMLSLETDAYVLL